MTSPNPAPRNSILAAFLPFSQNHGFLAVNRPPLANSKHPSLLSSKTDHESIWSEAGSDSRMLLNPQSRDGTHFDGNASETSEGSSIDFDAPPGINKSVPIVSQNQNGHSTAARLDSDPDLLQTLADPVDHDAHARLGPDSPIPPSLKKIINKWCASKGSSYSLSRLPCLTTRDQKYVTQSTSGRLATWETRDGKPMTATMYAISGTDLKQGQQKILVVQGSTEVLGPYMVSYTNEESTGNRVAFKKWIGLDGDRDGFEKDYSVVKKFPVQTQLLQTKRRNTLPRLSIGDIESLTTNLDRENPKSRKRKRQINAQDHPSLFDPLSHSGPDETATGNQISATLTSQTANAGCSQTARSQKSSQAIPTVNIPGRTTSSKDHMWQTLESPPRGVYAEVILGRHSPQQRASNSRTSRSRIVAKLDPSTNDVVDESAREPIPAATKGKSTMACNSAQRTLKQKATLLDYPTTLPPGSEAAQGDVGSDMPPMLPLGHKSVLKLAPPNCPPVLSHDHGSAKSTATTVWEKATLASQLASTTPKSSPLTHSQAPSEFDQTTTSIAGAHSLREKKGMNELIESKNSVQKLTSGEPVTEKGVDVAGRTVPVLASSIHRATATKSQSKGVDHGVERKHSAATTKTIAPSVHVEKPRRSVEPAVSPLLLHTRKSTEATSTAAGQTRMPNKVRKKLQLQHVVVKFNSALPQEPPRIRPFTSCDTVQKLFQQARTGDVFGRASDVRPGGKLLTIEFRGSGRLHDEVYLVNEDDEEDYYKMRSALLKKDWWTQVDDDIVGGGLLDVRDAK